MVIANYIAYVLTILGAFNWGLVGMFNFNLVSWICGAPANVGTTIIYVIIFLAAIWLIISPIISRGRLELCRRDKNNTK